MDVTTADPLVGQVLDGRYAVHARIARGGMATVYRGVDQRLGREVAIKVMHPGLAEDESFVRRFTREAQSAARLGHPNVVQVFDQGRHDRLVYLAMEYVPGRTLRDVMRTAGAMRPGDALDVLEPVLDALAAAHQAGIVHRDVKPENVLIADDGRVKVADFGLVRVSDATQGHSQTGAVYGTVSYLAPEQVNGGMADPRSDVYAAGVVLFEMVTGSKPFSGDTPVQVALQHLSSRVPTPSSWVPSVPAPLDDLVALATARDPEARPANARDLLVALREARRRIPLADLDAIPQHNPAVTPMASIEHTQVLGQTGAHTTVQPPLALPVEPGPIGLPAVTSRPAPRRASRSTRSGRSSGRLVLAGVLVAAVLLGVGAWFLGALPGTRVVVPTLVGLPEQRAQRALVQQGLRGEVSRRFDDTVPSGRVISADPPRGSRQPKDSVVRLVVSRGPSRVKVPQVVGRSEDDARGALEGAGLRIGEVDERYDDEVPEGEVISTSPVAGRTATKGSQVDVVVSQGPAPVEVADWRGKSAEEAKRTLGSAGLRVQITEEFSNDVAPGLVIAQEPGPGTVERGTTVRLVVSRGPQTIQLPDVTGQTVAQAREQLKSLGLRVRLRGVFGGRPRDDSQVVSQTPAAGTAVPPKSGVVLVAF
ncbi:MAG: Stk1 family PASTA domain-containing Ser/Thr kinase [Angustibacter sp.]